jgi:hypothetical protein
MSFVSFTATPYIERKSIMTAVAQGFVLETKCVPAAAQD